MIQIALDGPAGSGKSTVAKAVAKALRITYLDTGAMYRSLTYYALKRGVDIDNAEALCQVLPDFNLTISESLICVNGEDVSQRIRREDVTKNVSAVAAVADVRRFMVDIQHDIANSQSIVMDGRDIGTVVLPEADYKFFITASDEVRAKRRHAELVSKGVDLRFEDVMADMKRRDEYDSNREHSPLRIADDAEVIDTSNMTVDAVVNYIIERVSDG